MLLPLFAQILALPEAAVVGTHNNADGFKRRTAYYTEHNRPEAAKNTSLFFEEKAKMEVLEVAVDGASVDAAATIDTVLAPYIDAGGTAYNYHPTEEEVAAAVAAQQAADVSASFRELFTSLVCVQLEWLVRCDGFTRCFTVSHRLPRLPQCVQQRRERLRLRSRSA